MWPYLRPPWTNSCQIWCVRVFHHVLLKYGHENAEMQKKKKKKKKKIHDVTLQYSIGKLKHVCICLPRKMLTLNIIGLCIHTLMYHPQKISLTDKIFDTSCMTVCLINVFDLLFRCWSMEELVCLWKSWVLCWENLLTITQSGSLMFLLCLNQEL